MTTKILTPNTPHPLTGLTNPVLGWHFISSQALDVFEGAKIIQYGGWTWNISPNPNDQELQQMSATLGSVRVEINDTQWFIFDGKSVRTLEEADVADNYTVTDWPGPPAPP